jgi:hypothetical protein
LANKMARIAWKLMVTGVGSPCEPVSGVAEQKFRRFENTHQRLGPKTGLKSLLTGKLTGNFT